MALWLKMEIDRRGPGDYLCVSPTFPLMEPRVLPEMKSLFEHDTHWGIYKPGYHRFESHQQINGEPAYRIFMGSAANPESLESSTVLACAIDELAQSQFSRQSWEAIRRRCAIHNARIFYATTLYDISSWYVQELWKKYQDGDPTINIIQCDSISNPAFSRQQWDIAKKSLPAWKFDLFYRGILTRPSNLVYDAFDEMTQVIPAFNLKLEQYKEWPRYVGHDFGPSNTAAVWVAQDPGTGFLYVCRDYHKGGLSVGQHAAEFKRLSASEPIRTRIGGAWAEEEARYAYLASGWPIMKPAIRDVEAGIDQVYSFIAKNQLFVFDECQDFIREITSYTRELDENYEVTETIQNKSRFHLMDCLRYLFTGFSPERADSRKEAHMKVTKEPRKKRPFQRRRGRVAA